MNTRVSQSEPPVTRRRQLVIRCFHTSLPCNREDLKKTVAFLGKVCGGILVQKTKTTRPEPHGGTCQPSSSTLSEGRPTLIQSLGMAQLVVRISSVVLERPPGVLLLFYCCANIICETVPPGSVDFCGGDSTRDTPCSVAL